MRVGYILIKADDEDAAASQRLALGEAGCEQIIEDLASGGQCDQSGLHRLLDQLGPGDVMVVPQLSCVGGSLSDVVRVMGHIGTADAGFRSLAEVIDTTTLAGRAAAEVVVSLAAFERTAARDRISAGLAAARAEGRVGGRRPKLTAGQRAAIVDTVLSGCQSAADMARLHKVSEATVSRLLATYRSGTEPHVKGGQEQEVGAGQHGDRIAGVLPLSALDGRVAIVGTSGSGKTYAAKGLVERLTHPIQRAEVHSVS